MIGNDVISLAEATRHKRALHPRFLKKVLVGNEWDLMHESQEPEQTLWTLWALKESAYKVEFKLIGKRLFAPKRYECFFDSTPDLAPSRRAQIQTPVGLFPGHVSLDDECIHARVADSEASLQKSAKRCFRIKDQQPEKQSQIVRTALRQSLAYQWRMDADDIGIWSEKGYPEVRVAHDARDIDISLSHHGYWGAFAFCPSELTASG